MLRFGATMFALTFMLAAPTNSAELRLSLENEQPRILLTGSIEAGDAAKLRELINSVMNGRDYQQTGLVAFNSSGGNFLEGIELGMVLRRAGWGSRVLSSHSCLSSCALAFLGGAALSNPGGWSSDRAIRTGARLGFHAFFSRSNEPIPARVGTDAGRFAANLLYAYFAQLGIEPAFAIATLEMGPQDLLIVNTPELLKALGIRLIDMPSDFDTRMTSAAALNVCMNVTGWNPAGGEWIGNPDVVEISSDLFRRKMLKKILAPLSNNPRFKPGPITAALAAGESADNVEDLRRAYIEANILDMVPDDPENKHIFMVAGLDNVRHFRSQICYVLVSRDGQNNMSAHVVLTPAEDVFGRFQTRGLVRHGGIIFEMHRLNEPLW
ncbi:MAG: hypothetical protein LCH62_01735 [Proteobacteria bacterium]|nr:hypothetical protein [Pseudomonadota bacterium]MCA0448471.1 hypothetical protein [Pseudomonadota bacterium]